VSEAVDLFDGRTLDGWHRVPRVPVPVGPGVAEPDSTTAEYLAALGSLGTWSVEGGAIIGGQDPPGSGLGAYLVTDASYADFELTFEVWPDWPADTGILLRSTDRGAQGFQVLIDHRKSGGIGGFYGNGIGGFHALTHTIDVVRDEGGRPVGLTEEDASSTLEPVTPDKKAMLSFAAPANDFHAAWKWNDYNEIRVRCVGEYPVLTTWINGVLMYELDTATIQHPGYDPAAVAALLGRAGHISLEVHDNDPRMGDERWGKAAVVRWRNLRLTAL
jgi:hypothetical protein